MKVPANNRNVKVLEILNIQVGSENLGFLLVVILTRFKEKDKFNVFNFMMRPKITANLINLFHITNV